MAYRGGYQGQAGRGGRGSRGGHHHGINTGSPFGNLRGQQQGSAFAARPPFGSHPDGGNHHGGAFGGRQSHGNSFGGHQEQGGASGGGHPFAVMFEGPQQHGSAFDGGQPHDNPLRASFAQYNHQHSGPPGGHHHSHYGRSVSHGQHQRHGGHQHGGYQHREHQQGGHQHGSYRGTHHQSQQRGPYNSQPIPLHNHHHPLGLNLPYDEPDYEDPITHIRIRAITTNNQTIDFPLPFRRLQLSYGSRMLADLNMDSTEPGLEIEDKVSSMVSTNWGPVHPMDYVLRWLHSFDPIPIPPTFRGSTQLNLGHLSDQNDFVDLARLWRACWRLNLNEPFKRQNELGQAIFDAVRRSRLQPSDVATMYEILEGLQRNNHMIRLVARQYVEGLSERELSWHEGILQRFNANIALRDQVIKPLLEEATNDGSEDGRFGGGAPGRSRPTWFN